MNSAPNTIRAIWIECSALSGAVMAPSRGFVEKRRCAATMSKWRLFTGTSVGSQMTRPEWWVHSRVWLIFTSFSKSSIVP